MAVLWESGYPLIIDNTTGTTVTASGALNQSGMLYSVILPAASGDPSSAQVAAGQGDDGSAVVAGFANSAEASASGVEVLLSGYGLTSETDYVMYIVGSGYVDDAIQATPTGLAFTTPDITIPAWNSGYPSITSITTTGGTVSFNLTDAGSGYYVIVPSGSSEPSAAQIKAGTDAADTALAAGLYGGSAVTANVVATVAATGLSYSQYYTIYAVGEDEALNATSPAVVSANFRAALPNVATPNTFMRNVKERRKLDNALRNM